MKQSNSASINFTIIYIVKEHRHVLLYFYTHHLAHIDYKIRRIALSNCYPGCCIVYDITVYQYGKNVLYFFYSIAQKTLTEEWREIFRVDIELYQYGS